MIEIRRCYDCGNWFDDSEHKRFLLCPRCRAAANTVTGRYRRDPIPELEIDDREVEIHCVLPQSH